MCYETSLTKSAKQIEKRTGARFIDQVDYRPYYHASSFNFPSLYGITDDYKKTITTMEWGMIAPWGTNDIENYRKKNKNWNAKGETMLDLPTFSQAARSRRCLILADGFIEPHYPGNQFRGPVVPKYCYLPNKKLFCFAGLYNEADNGQLNCSIVTVDANPFFAALHNKKRRMPLVLDEAFTSTWLDSSMNDDEIMELVYTGSTKEAFEAHSIKNFYKRDFDTNTAEFLEPISDPEGVQGSLF
ncbi:SOS response-associated peptidase [Zunongwangia endophytica]|uniref:Abasic site processing protein n=1 Tax=Zunongwangia endophytica TaxID=1808945 RepID=A0ABV8H8R6_9FLAO|nr:SOS response-associated peptidase family protein [Zunongwangia endophytica]MDN3594383.1 SOS response-associated peptidase family protein [Zunongwangia endophytica]